MVERPSWRVVSSATRTGWTSDLLRTTHRWTAVELIANAASLTELVGAFEREQGFEPSGCYQAFNLVGTPFARARLTGLAMGRRAAVSTCSCAR